MKKYLLYISVVIFSSIIASHTASAASKTAVAQDMYLQIYKEISDNPQSAASKTVADKYKMSSEEINKIVKEGDLSPLAQKQKNAKIEELFLQYKKISNDYSYSLETENLRGELELKTKPSEIFMDGDTSNSEFDILYDLTIIELILFNEASISEFGGQFITPDFDFTDKNEQALINDLFNIETQESTASESIDVVRQDGFSPLSCIEDESNLANALAEFESGTNSEGDGTGETELDEGAEQEFPKAESDEWPTKYLCPEGLPYCIEISFDIKMAKAYTKSDNCIACHVQNINKELDTLLSRPLSGNKLSGNLFEMPKCKSSYVNLPLSMNIIALAVQPPRQANQDKYIKLDIEKELVKLKERFNLFFNNTKNEPPKTSIEDRSTKEAIQSSASNATIDEIAVKKQERLNVIKTELQEGLETKKQEISTELNNTEYQTVVNELETMKKSFDTILGKFKEMKTPCTDLSTKAYCS